MENTLRYSAPPYDIQFLSSLKFLNHNLDEMTVLHPTTENPVFIFLIAPENTPATSGHAEDTMLKLLKEVDVPGMKVVHGVCVCGSRAAFYEYDCERQLVSPAPQGQVHYDWDLATHSGAVHFIQVVEDVKQMYQELINNFDSEI